MATQWKTKTYLIELTAAFTLYAVLLIGSNLLEKSLRPTGAPLLALNLLPMVGILAAAWAIIRGFGRMDELQRKIQSEALLLSFLGTAIISMGWGFLEDSGIPKLRAFSVWPLMGILWCLALVITTRRYR
jgi:hypothetical protein